MLNIKILLNIIFIFGIFSQSSCNICFINKTGYCKVLFKDIKKTWKYDTQKKIYYLQDVAKYKLEYFVQAHRDCLIGLSKKKIIQLFGTPSVIQGNMFKYYMSEECFNQNQSCVYMYAKFKDNADELIELKIGTVEKSVTIN